MEGERRAWGCGRGGPVAVGHKGGQRIYNKDIGEADRVVAGRDMLLGVGRSMGRTTLQ
jgi:hypothetical protein